MTTPTDPSMQAAALALAEAGWHVFPCIPRGPKAKAPLTARGHLDASSDPAAIRKWWTRWPEALIGAVVPESLLVLDFDPRNGGTVAALEAVVGPLPATLTAWSGRGDGGRHLYFLRPYGELSGAGLPVGVDFKLHGYCILPPSLHPVSGQAYRWEIRAAAALPPRLRELLRAARAARPAAYRPGRGSGDGGPLVRLVLSLPDGQRNRGLFWAAARAAETGILATVEADLLAAAVSLGLPEREARRTIASASRAARARR